VEVYWVRGGGGVGVWVCGLGGMGGWALVMESSGPKNLCEARASGGHWGGIASRARCDRCQRGIGSTLDGGAGWGGGV